MKKLIRKIIGPVYVCTLIFFVGMGITSYIRANSILRDHTVVTAPMELVDISERTRKGHTTVTYDFQYSYSVGEQQFTNAYSAVNDKGERYVDAPQMEIAYSNANPDKSGALHLLKRQSSLKSLIWRMLVAGAILGFVALVINAWAQPKEEEDAEPTPA